MTEPGIEPVSKNVTIKPDITLYFLLNLHCYYGFTRQCPVMKEASMDQIQENGHNWRATSDLLSVEDRTWTKNTETPSP